MRRQHVERALVTDEEHAERIKRIKAELVAAGRKPYIESPVVYRLLDAVLAEHIRDRE
jgi:hypothetical protein